MPDWPPSDKPLRAMPPSEEAVPCRPPRVGRRSIRARPWLGPLTGIFPLLLVACGGEGSASADSAPGRLDGPDVEIRPRVETLYTVGAFDGEDWETFGDVTAVAFDSAGRLFILDGDAKRITVLARDGGLLTSFGKEGEGPGELLQPLGFAVRPSGEVTLFDLGQLGFQTFSAEGEFLGSTLVDPEAGMPGQRLLPTTDGELLTTGGLRISTGARGAASMQVDTGRPIEAFSIADGSHRSAYEAWRPPPPEGEDPASFQSGGDRIQLTMQTMRAFDPDLHFAPLSDGRLAVADSIGYRVKLVGRDGTVLEILERPIPPTPVTEAIRQKERENRLAAAQSSGGARLRVVGGGGGVSIDRAAIQRMLEERIESMEFANEIPVIADMGVDGEDRIWVERSAPVPGEDGPTDLITADGQYLGTIPADGVRIPDAFGPAGLLAYIETDEFDVERVRVVQLRESDPMESGG